MMRKVSNFSNSHVWAVKKSHLKVPLLSLQPALEVKIFIFAFIYMSFSNRLQITVKIMLFNHWYLLFLLAVDLVRKEFMRKLSLVHPHSNFTIETPVLHFLTFCVPDNEIKTIAFRSLNSRFSGNRAIDGWIRLICWTFIEENSFLHWRNSVCTFWRFVSPVTKFER